MHKGSFYIDETGNRPIICSRDTDIRIEVFNLEDEHFVAPKDKVVFYADDHGTHRAFVVHSVPFKEENVADAFKWYSNYLDYPQMVITMKDPRPPFKLHIVR
jgi:hypothetical protein